MTDRRYREPSDEEPAVTFEFPDEGTREPTADRWRRAGVTAAAGAALVSSGASDVSAGSLDVFDDLTAGESFDPDLAYPVTDDSEALAGASADPDFPPLDFSVTSAPEDPSLAGIDEVMFGAVAEIGGGHVLDGADPAPSSEAFGASNHPVSESEAWSDHDDPDSDDDFDLTDLDFD